MSYCTVLYSTQLYWHAVAMLLAGIMPGLPAAAAACNMHGAWQRLVAGSSWPGRVKQPETVTLEVYCVITLSATPPTRVE
jgi:hypothetical protein